MWGGTRSSLLQSQIFYVYGPRPPAFRYVPIVRGSGVSEQGVPLFTGLSLPLLLSGLPVLPFALLPLPFAVSFWLLLYCHHASLILSLIHI